MFIYSILLIFILIYKKRIINEKIPVLDLFLRFDKFQESINLIVSHKFYNYLQGISQPNPAQRLTATPVTSTTAVLVLLFR